MVLRASLLALDLLECRDLHAPHDDLHLFRHSTPKCAGGAEAELAWIHLLQPGTRSAVRSSRPRRASRLAALGSNRRDVGSRAVPRSRSVGETDVAAKSDPD